MMPLRDLVAKSGVELDAFWGEADVFDLASHTSQVQSQSMFVAMPSARTNTNAFLSDAKSKGASAAMVGNREGEAIAHELGLAGIRVEGESRFFEALWRMSKVAFDNPSSKLRVIGITGTNGKTTTAWILRSVLQALGRRAAYLGTLGYEGPNGNVELQNTTPFSVDLNRLLARAVQDNVEDWVMEVSSHALVEKRVDGIEFDIATFTNLTQDHLDFHHTMEAYEKAKWRLFSDLPAQSEKPFVAALNVDDPVGEKWSRAITYPCVKFGERGEFSGEIQHVDIQNIEMQFSVRGSSATAKIPIGGLFNVKNCLTVAATLYGLGYTLEQICEGLSHAKPVPGRFEAVKNDQRLDILVDYAHTPDALENLLQSVRPLAQGRIITVFGCGGDRDRTKRPKMAAVAGALSDCLVVTSDNPRTEDPEMILRDVESGIPEGCKFVSIVDRREAVCCAVGMAAPGDVVVIAGKGHEDYQIIGHEKFPMDDRELVREALKQRQAGGRA